MNLGKHKTSACWSKFQRKKHASRRFFKSIFFLSLFYLQNLVSVRLPKFEKKETCFLGKINSCIVIGKLSFKATKFLNSSSVSVQGFEYRLRQQMAARGAGKSDFWWLSLNFSDNFEFPDQVPSIFHGSNAEIFPRNYAGKGANPKTVGRTEKWWLSSHRRTGGWYISRKFRENCSRNSSEQCSVRRGCLHSGTGRVANAVSYLQRNLGKCSSARHAVWTAWAGSVQQHGHWNGDLPGLVAAHAECAHSCAGAAPRLALVRWRGCLTARAVA